jgi:hypothetical protein
MKEPLYIFLHIPKTAGLTFRYHAKKNLNNDEILSLSFDRLGLDIYDAPHKVEVYTKKADKFFSSLSKEQKDKIKLVFGHPIPYGIHKHFDRPTRYFIFLRNPIARTPSVYNYLVMLLEKTGNFVRRKNYLEKTLLVNRKLVDFPTWINKKYKNKETNKLLTMTGRLKSLGYLKTFSYADIKSSLDKFYFVGLTKNYSQESLFLYHLLGFNKFFFDQNISRKYFQIDESDKKIIQVIKNKNKEDITLYNQAQKFNTEFKKNFPNFESIVQNKEKERKLKMPLTQILFAPRKTIIRIKSAILGDIRLFSE